MSGQVSLEEIRGFYAKLMMAASKSEDPRLERIFEQIPREAFFPPGPWHIKVANSYVETPSANPVYLYQNSLIALDAVKRINNGEPFLHAAWIGAVSPQRGESVSHIGAGLGYYTAVLSMLTLPNGSVTAFEIDERLAEQARENLKPFHGVVVTHADATRTALSQSDIIYVNAGVAAPPVPWLNALKKGGRMIFPWRPSENFGLTLLVRAETTGFSVKPLMPSQFIPCIGASVEVKALKKPDSRAETLSIRSIWITADKAPDDTAVAVYPEIWLSSSSLS